MITININDEGAGVKEKKPLKVIRPGGVTSKASPVKPVEVIQKPIQQRKAKGTGKSTTPFFKKSKRSIAQGLQRVKRFKKVK